MDIMEWIQLLETLASPLNKNFIAWHCFNTTFLENNHATKLSHYVSSACCFVYIQILLSQKPYGASLTRYLLVLFQDVTFILQTSYGNSQAYQLEGVNLM